jgi:Protein of unknown function (DUF2799)
MRILVTLGMLAGFSVLAGCSSMSANECLATDWRTVGYEDGVSGYSGDRVGQYRKACTKHGITPNLDQYQGGRDQGLKEFCKPLNGFRVGARGRGYNGVCPAQLDGPFLSAYESGRQLYNLRSRVGSAANEIQSMRAESDQLEANIASAAAQMLNPELTKEQRAQLLIDTKHMAERKGEIKAQLPQLESDLQMYQRELDDYRATLAYVE